MDTAQTTQQILFEPPTRLSQLKSKLEAAGVDLFKHRDLYEWLLDAMVSEYKQGMADASKIYKEVYKLETK